MTPDPEHLEPERWMVGAIQETWKHGLPNDVPLIGDRPPDFGELLVPASSITSLEARAEKAEAERDEARAELDKYHQATEKGIERIFAAYKQRPEPKSEEYDYTRWLEYTLHARTEERDWRIARQEQIEARAEKAEVERDEARAELAKCRNCKDGEGLPTTYLCPECGKSGDTP